MPRCCSGAGCACLIQAGAHVSVLGTGSAQDPYVLAVDTDLEAVDNTTFNVSVGGSGVSADPWTIAVSFASTASIGNLPDVDTSGKLNTYVLAWNSTTNKWQPQAPTTASSGSVSHDSALVGDGSGGNPLGINEDPNGYLVTGSNGLGLTDTAKTSLNRRFGTAAARSADTLTPVLNEITMLDTAPGVQWYWTGSQWLPTMLTGMVNPGAEFLALSGSYVANTQLTMVTRKITVTTDATGAFDILTVSDLASANGVLTCHFQETGTIPYKAMVYGNIDHVSATAYRLDDGTAYASQSITGIVTAYVY